MTTFCFDIDGTICTQEVNYEDAIPLTNRIKKINALHEAGHYIKFFSARGSVSGDDWKRRSSIC